MDWLRENWFWFAVIILFIRAEHRGFAPGWEMDDWLEAEAEIREGRSPQSA